MRAIVRADDALSIRDVPPPRLSGPNSVRLRVELAALCRTDWYVATGRLRVREPRILGHECAGTITELGAGVHGLRVGQRITIDPVLPCGTCKACRTGDARFCSVPRFVGVSHDGAFAEEMVIPAACVNPVPDGLSCYQAAYVEPVAASLAVLNADLPRSGRGLIYGSNRIAELTRRILVADGFSDVVTDQPTVSALNENEFDFVIETRPDELRTMLHLLRPRGTLVFKSRQIEPIDLHVAPLLRKEPILRAVNYGSFPDAIALLASGRLAIDDLIGTTRPLDDFDAVFAACGSESEKAFFAVSEEAMTRYATSPSQLQQA